MRLVVGIGASAGGLEAFSRLLRSLPSELPVACVLVQHLAPAHESILPHLLSGVTAWPVIQVTEGQRLSSSTIYVIPPNTSMRLDGDILRLSPRQTARGETFSPVDVFLESLGDACGPRAVGVVLSGTASDGALGARRIKERGGTVLVQDPKTAAFRGMPEAAIGTGVADAVLSPELIAAEIARLSALPPGADRRVGERVRTVKGGGAKGRRIEPAPEAFEVTDDEFQEIYSLLRRASGVDFSQYKTPTITRRLQRRMGMLRQPSVARYIAHLRDTPDAVFSLYQDLLIHVTRFFREPESFHAIQTEILPRLLEGTREDSPIRVWVPGCSTGEEAYSAAIVILEYLSEHNFVRPIQIFATDVSEQAVERARAGQYPPSIEEDVSPERLRRFFNRTENGYHISKAVRDLCVFARQDLSRDPPFSRLDLVLCRNVLIYLAQPLQRKIMSIFHYALKPTGFLVLGSAETTGPHADLFAMADKKHRFYRKKQAPARAPGVDFGSFAMAGAPEIRIPRGVPPSRGVPTAEALAADVILDRYAPPAVVVDSSFQIVQSRGRTSPFLRLAPGGASLGLLKMAREGLVYGLRSVLGQAKSTGKTSRREGLRIESDGESLDVSIDVTPLNTGHGDGASPGDRHYLVVFRGTPLQPAPEAGGRPRRAKSAKTKRSDESARVQRLRRELEGTRGYLQAIIQDLEAANEELQSANEEILSSNEELQSTNEELDTAKEELQSTNEEINTVNEELHGRNEELARAHSDLVNLLNTVNLAVVIVDRDLRIRRFTPLAERLLNLIPSDAGRRIGHIRPDIELPDPEALLTSCIREVVPLEREVRDREGHWYNLRIRPYKDTDNRIDGAVLTLYDITAAKQHEAEIAAALDFAQAAIESVPEPLVVLDAKARVRTVNNAFAALVGVEPSQARGRHLHELGDREVAAPEFRELVDELQNRDGDGAVLEREIAGPGGRRLRATGRRVSGSGTREATVVLTIRTADQPGPGGGRGGDERAGPGQTP